MSSNGNPLGAMPGMSDSGDPGDENDSKWQQCEQEIESLETRVAALEQKAGINSPADEAESPAPQMKKGPKPFFGGSY